MIRSDQLTLVDLPKPANSDLYDRAIDKVLTILSATTCIASVYQVGSVRHPGISDIDLLVVVDDTSSSNVDPFNTLTPSERYLFTHSCFVVPATLASELASYSLMGGYRLLFGTSWQWERADDPSVNEYLQTQTALEFLAKNLLDLYVQVEYRILKVRVLLQHLKGIQLDVDLLAIEDERLNAKLRKSAELIDHWFQLANAEEVIAGLALDLLPLLRDAVSDSTANHRLYAPSSSTISFSRNMTVDGTRRIALSRHGVRLPQLPGLRERRYFNVQHRLNRFQFELPMTVAPGASYHERRFDFLRRAKCFASSRFPTFAAPLPPLFYRSL